MCYNKLTRSGGKMKYKVKFTIYIIIVVLLAVVIWIKYDHDRGEKLLHSDITLDQFEEFIRNNNIKKVNFTCPAKNETIIYLDDKYMLTNLGEIYKVKFDYLFNNGYNCEKIQTPLVIKGFYNENIVYDEDYTLYDLNNNLNPYDESNKEYYLEDLNNLNIVKKDYPYIYFYDVSAHNLILDDSIYSQKILIDNRGGIDVYTNYGYPTALSLLENTNVEVIFNRGDYEGTILSIFRSKHNEKINIYKTKYLTISEEVTDNVCGLRIITTNGMYNEVMDDTCHNDICDTILKLDKEFSTHFDDILFSNGKYVFIKSTPTTIYNIENYISK